VYLAEEFRRVLDDATFLDALPGYLLPDAASQSRKDNIQEKLEAIASFSPNV